MAIVKMNKFYTIGIDTAADTLIKQLMDLGAIELNSQNSKMKDEEWSSIVSIKESNDGLSELEEKIDKVDSALAILQDHDKGKKPLFDTRKLVSEEEFAINSEEININERDVDEILEQVEIIHELKIQSNKLETEIVGLTPWIADPIPLEIQETEYTYILSGILPPELDMKILLRSLNEVTEFFEITHYSEDSEQKYLTMIYSKGEDGAIHKVLKEYEFSKVLFKGLTGSASKNISFCKSEMINIEKKLDEAEKTLEYLVVCKDDIRLYYDYLVAERDRAKSYGNLLTTDRAFYLDGWIPASLSEELEELLKQNGCYYDICEPEKDEETPVLLNNNKLIEPIESITVLYDTPNSREIDPTPVYAFFYVCFFGIMFADIGYGIILAAGCFILLKAKKIEGNFRKFVKQLGYCGISTIIWGVIFGSFFGNLLTVTTETFFSDTVSLRPLWINPVQDSMTMLIFACTLGVLHLFVALGVKAWEHIKDGNVIEAINDSFLWYLLITGLCFLLAGDNLFTGAADVGKWLSIVGAAGIVFLPGFTGKGVGRFLGLWNLYGITRYLSDILSYARLLALCLAGSVIAEVFNILAAYTGGGIFGVLPFILIVLIAHSFNFLASALGAFVHSIRLQYVEFFGKFYEGKGVPFEPFMKNTKYVKIIKEGK